MQRTRRLQGLPGAPPRTGKSLSGPEPTAWLPNRSGPRSRTLPRPTSAACLFRASMATAAPPSQAAGMRNPSGRASLLTGIVSASCARPTSPPWAQSNGAGFAGEVCQRLPKYRLGALETAAPRARTGCAQAHCGIAPPHPRASSSLGLLNYACAEAFRVRLLGRRNQSTPAQCYRLVALEFWPA